MPTDKPFKKNSPFRLSDSEIIEIIKSELGVISVQSVFEKINHFKLIDSNITNDSVINHNIEKLLQENDRLKNQSINIKSVLENTFNDNNYLETYSKSILIQSLKTNKEERKEIERKIMNMRRKLSYYQEIQGQKNEYIEVANFVPKKYSY
jgi:hypothetical protein